MKIVEVTYNHILFSNGDEITFDHCQQCCEDNFADFEQVDDIALSYDFEELKFEESGYGFRFGDAREMFFVPCYSIQNGWYSDDVDIYLNGNLVLSCTGSGEED